MTNLPNWTGKTVRKFKATHFVQSDDPGLQIFCNHLLQYLADDIEVEVTPELRNEVLALEQKTSFYINDNGIKKRVIGTNSFHHRPRHDSVKILNEDNDSWYGRVLLIFSVRFRNTKHSLLYVHWYQTAAKSEGFPRTPLQHIKSWNVIDASVVKDVVFVSPNFRSQDWNRYFFLFTPLLTHLNKHLNREVDFNLPAKMKERENKRIRLTDHPNEDNNGDNEAAEAETSEEEGIIQENDDDHRDWETESESISSGDENDN